MSPNQRGCQRMKALSLSKRLLKGCSSFFVRPRFKWQTPCSGKTIATYRGHSAPIHRVIWSPDGKYIASASGDSTVQVWEATAGKSALVIVILGLFMLYTSSCGRHLYLCGTRYPFVKNTLTGQFRDELESRNPLLKLSGIVDAPAPRHTQLGERGIQLRESQGQRAKYVKRQLAAGKMVGESLEQFLHLLVRQVLESPSATIIAGLSLRTWSRKTLLANESASRIGPVTGRAQGIAQ